MKNVDTNENKCYIDYVAKNENTKRGGDDLVNEQLLENRIEASGLKKQFIAAKLGISANYFSQKCHNAVDFKTSEVDILCALLGIRTMEEMQAIFFADSVLKNENKEGSDDTNKAEAAENL